MEPLSVREYRNNLSAAFDRADKGEQLLIRRRNKVYALISIGNEDLVLTPHLQKRIEEAEAAWKSGECITCKSKEELDNFFDSL